MAYELFYSPGACSLAAHIVLEEVGADYTLQLVSVANGETAREPFISINPKGRVPVLRIVGEPEVLTELPAILFYLARQHPASRLVPTEDPLAEARCAEWLAWLAGWVHGVGYGLLWRPERFSEDPAHRDVLVARGGAVIAASYADIEKKFQDGRQWATGEQYSIVDPFLLVLYGWGLRIGMPMREQYPHWSASIGRAMQRPVVTRTLVAEGVSIAG